jgi:hypothetical protein
MPAKNRLRVKTGARILSNEKDAMEELFSKIHQPDMEAAIFFCSSRFDLVKLGKEHKKTFSCPRIGYTTAGEISTNDCHEGGIVKNTSFIGFRTYGEQFNSVHVNQTLTGVAIGE